MPAIVSSAVVAEALNLTERRVEQLAHEGLPRLGRGKYDLWSCAQWYIRYLQKAIERRATDSDDGSKTNLNEEKKRLTRMQANIAEVEYKQKIGELIPAHLVDDKFVTFAGTVHQRFLALPSRVASRLEGESRDVIRVKLYEAVRDLLNGLSNDLLGKKSGNGDKRDRKPAGKRATGKVTAARRGKTRRSS
jgi:phage terminase Nu1 subunit (DNA packaging protein)